MGSRKKARASTPVVIDFGDGAPRTIEFDPSLRQVFVLAGEADQMLVVVWDMDDAGYGFWRIKTLGVKNDKIITKEFEPGSSTAAFYGEATAVGAQQTELWHSFGFQDDDETNEDGVVTNKVKEIRVYPVPPDYVE
jgi:hypothetical protein